MTCKFREIKEFLLNKINAFAAKIKIRKKLGEIEKIASDAGEKMTSGIKNLIAKTKPQPAKKKKKHPLATAAGILAAAAAIFTVLVSIFYVIFSISDSKKRSGYVTVKRR